jgi:hypothetical protein
LRLVNFSGAEKPKFARRFKVGSMGSRPPENFRLTNSEKQNYCRAIPPRQEGRFGRSSRHVERGMRWTRWRRARSFVRTNSADADAKSCGPGLPTLRPSSREMISRAIGANKPGPQGERAISVKTIAQGMPDDSAEPVVPSPCFFHCTGAMGCGQHPAFPAPSLISEGGPLYHSGAICAARMRSRISHTLFDI